MFCPRPFNFRLQFASVRNSSTRAVRGLCKQITIFEIGPLSSSNSSEISQWQQPDHPRDIRADMAVSDDLPSRHYDKNKSDQGDPYNYV